ncbi:unnamed protein product [Bursaphelenchus xylophilus]|uniref:(pine wood nematode) hypothetical protein n=1 Tax=Bursaphelenchus xylophilus TaxID=6326 RepID=A0A1I7SEY1_BURXY|nr:unnamed protein product [Bursaphelenchus xylophilus]CAG9113714.1 unnamed protein product [Bursaphelenchus xylophilus]
MWRRLPRPDRLARTMHSSVNPRRRATSAPPPSRFEATLTQNPTELSGRVSRRDQNSVSQSNSRSRSSQRSPRTPPGAVVIYTDGSCHGNYASGVGIYLGENHPLNLSQPLHSSLHSSGLAEIKACQIALERLKNWPGYRNEHVVIRTDYKPLIDILISRRPATYSTEIAEVRRLAESFPNGVTFQHIYGHNGHAAQERADELARLATVGQRRARSASPFGAPQAQNQDRSRSRSRERSRSRSRQRSLSRQGRKGAGVEIYIPHRSPNEPLDTARPTTSLATTTPSTTTTRPAAPISSESSVEMPQWPFQAEERPSRSREVVRRNRPSSANYLTGLPTPAHARTRTTVNPRRVSTESNATNLSDLQTIPTGSEIQTGSQASTARDASVSSNPSTYNNVHRINVMDHGFVSDTGSFNQNRSRSRSANSRNVPSPPSPHGRPQRSISGDATNSNTAARRRWRRRRDRDSARRRRMNRASDSSGRRSQSRSQSRSRAAAAPLNVRASRAAMNPRSSASTRSAVQLPPQTRPTALRMQPVRLFGPGHGNPSLIGPQQKVNPSSGRAQPPRQGQNQTSNRNSTSGKSSASSKGFFFKK